MARKSIRLDLEAYERLKAAQKPNESFSQTIKRLLRPPFDFEEYLGKIRKDPMSPKAAAAVREQIARRRRRSSRER